jgi:hypothetical protein
MHVTSGRRKQKADLTRLKTGMTKAGVLQRSNALQPSSKAKRLVFTNNDLQTTDGPFTEAKELIGGFVVMELPTIEDAIAVCKPYAAILGGTLEMEVRVLEESEEPA